MAPILFRWMVLTLSIVLASYTVDGIYVGSVLSALFAAALLGLLNVSFRPIVILLTLPINILTFGLFTLVINALMLKIASAVIPGFHVDGFWAAVFGALIISIVNWVLSSFIRERERIEPDGPDTIDLHRRDGDRWE